MLKSISLRDKITLWYSLLMLVVLAAFACAVYFLTDYVLEEMLERETRLSMEQLIAQIENEDGLLTFENEVPIASGSMYFITEENGSELASYGSDITMFDQEPIEPGVFRFVKRESERWLLLDSELVREDRFTFRVRVASSCALGDRVLSTLRLIFLTGIPLAMAIAICGGYLIAKKSLRPVSQIIRSAESISQGDLSARIPSAPVKDELGDLTDTLNTMLASVETAFKREQRFTSDASHELRTPVAVLRAYTESLLSQETLSTEQTVSLQTMLAECERMQKIIGQLLTITRGQEGRYTLCRETICVKDICEGVAESLSTQLKQADITLELNIPDELTITADQSLMTQLMLNLTENAIKYGHTSGHVEISACRECESVCIAVRDDGIGIPEESIPFLFERFYRVDTARDRSGTGLGLSIVDWIVKSHGGTVRVESQLGIGSAFTVILPQVLSGMLSVSRLEV
ncbi:MAG: HAMP domain-containing sensor histidine kinase [Eubacteriales bacterium]|nr:HAMP domain-containing sensor histidine kinase [Eubacteriales bacterium]MDD4513434.1 HAMP domain-containing sensor histidine kinase [Eubacteriales bacterium]